MRRALRDHIGVSFAIRMDIDIILDVFESYLDSKCRLNLYDSITNHRYGRANPPLFLSKPNGNMARVLDRGQFQTWIESIRRIVPLAKAIFRSEQDVRAITPLPLAFINRNIWGYYRSVIVEMRSLFPEGYFREAIDPNEVDEALRIWHFFHEEDTTVYGLGDSTEAWTYGRVQLNIWLERRLVNDVVFEWILC